MRAPIMFAACAAWSCAAVAGPLEDFEVIVARCKAAVDALPSQEVAYLAGTKDWVKRGFSGMVVRYDVKRTDSLVSPNIAHLEAEYVMRAVRAPDEAAANAADLERSAPYRFIRRTNFAYRADHWEAVDGVSRMQRWRDDLTGFDPGIPIRLSTEDVRKSNRHLAVCAGHPATQ